VIVAAACEAHAARSAGTSRSMPMKHVFDTPNT
jgi:hypothetical protein